MRLTPPETEMRRHAVYQDSTMSVPTRALVTEPLPPPRTDAAEHGCGQHGDLEADADVAADGA
jgi:hypothetical protein